MGLHNGAGVVADLKRAGCRIAVAAAMGLVGGGLCLSEESKANWIDVRDPHDWMNVPDPHAWIDPVHRHGSLGEAASASRGGGKPLLIYFFEGSKEGREDARKWGRKSAEARKLIREGYESIWISARRHPVLLKRYGLKRRGAVVLGACGGKIQTSFPEEDVALREDLAACIDRAKEDDAAFLERLAAFFKGDDPAAGENLSEECAERGRLGDVRRILDRMEEGKRLTREEASFRWGKACYGSEEWAKAEEAFRIAARADGDLSPWARLWLIRVEAYREGPKPALRKLDAFQKDERVPEEWRKRADEVRRDVQSLID